MAAHVRANANTKLYTAEMQTVGQNVKNKLKAQMNKLVESTKNELKVASSNGASTSAIKVEGSKPKNGAVRANDLGSLGSNCKVYDRKQANWCSRSISYH